MGILIDGKWQDTVPNLNGPDGQPLGYGKPTFLNRAFVGTSGWKAPPLQPFLEEFSGGRDLPQGV